MPGDTPKGRKPDYILSGLNKTTRHKGRVGAGWANPDGSITLKLSFGVVMASDPAVVFTLFPNRDKERPYHAQE